MTEKRRRYVQLSPRQLDVARLLQAGKTTSEIGQELWLEDGTVKALTARIYRELGISSRAELAAFDLATWGGPRSCDLCGRDYEPAREDQRFDGIRCARTYARLERAAFEPDASRRAVREYLAVHNPLRADELSQPGDA